MAHKHREDSPCECEKLKDAERDTLREGLKKCTEAREAERRAREEENAKRAADAEAEVKSLKKKLLAFQLATAVGVALLGQDVFDRITAKVDAATAIQHKITGEGGAAAPDAHHPPEPQKVGMGGWGPFVPKRNPFGARHQDVPEHTDGDISGVFAGRKPDTDPPPVLPPVVTPPTQLQQAVRKMDAPPDIAAVVPVEQPFDPYAVFLTPSTLPFDVYSTTLALGNNYGFGEYYGISSGGAAATSVPSPAPLTVFAVGGLMHTRKRA